MYVVRRSPNNPILSPDPGRTFESAAAFNGCAVKKGRDTYLIYRAMARPDPLVAPGTYRSTIGIAKLAGGERATRQREFIVPSEAWDAYGCEDPRTTLFEGRYYTFYTALGGVPFGPDNIKVACAVSDDLFSIAEKHLVTPFNAKAMALFPERIGGKVAVILLAHQDEGDSKATIAIAYADHVEEFFEEAYWRAWDATIGQHALPLVRSAEDFAEIGAAPVKTNEGWLLIYSYIQNYFRGDERVFGIEGVLLDRGEPQRVIGRTESPILVPEAPYEIYGHVGRVAFPAGALIEGKRLDIYYGGADTVCAKASLYLPHLLDAMLPGRREALVARAPENPIIVPDAAHPWRARDVMNAAAFDLDGEVQILFRAMSPDNTSTVGLATSKDGIHIDTVSDEPIYVPRADFEQKRGGAGGNSGCEDPRAIPIGRTLYMLYTSYDGASVPRVALTSIPLAAFRARDFSQWSMPVRISPSGIDDKDAAIIPKPIDGKYLVLHRINSMICMDCFNDLSLSEHAITRAIEILRPRDGTWEALKVGIAGPPVATRRGWLLFYHAVGDDRTYRISAALLDANDPTRVIARLAEPLLVPEKQWEKEGEVPNVVFSCGQVVRRDTIFLYYGGADKVLGVATLSLKDLLDRLDPKALRA
ncbi:MAG TPA: hypothetical protein VFL98_03535 [Candidatus Paceibacterota bacterium]|nr:hypothetical protein [Candidatus Paceibacterota bacterium]